MNSPRNGNAPLTVLLARPNEPEDALLLEWKRRGLNLFWQPAIEILPPDSWTEIDRAVQELVQHADSPLQHWLVFSSRNGVRLFFDRAESLVPDFVAQLKQGNVKIVSVGPGTDTELQARTGRPSDLIPSRFNAEGILDLLLPYADPGSCFWLLGADRGRAILQRPLEEKNALVRRLTVYRSVDIQSANPKIVQMMNQNQFDWVAVTSSSIARSLVRLFGAHLHQTRLASISALTSSALRESGLSVSVESPTATLPALLETILVSD